MNTCLKNAVSLFRFFKFELQGNSNCSDMRLSDIKEAIEDIKENYMHEIDLRIIDREKHRDNDSVKALDMLETCLSAVDCDFKDLEYYEFIELLERFVEIYRRHEADDLWFDELPCGDVRIIHEDVIDDIWTESLIEQVKECYDLSNVPHFVAIDWEQTAENCKIDGMGQHFATYDGEEHYSNGFYIFRTN